MAQGGTICPASALFVTATRHSWVRPTVTGVGRRPVRQVVRRYPAGVRVEVLGSTEATLGDVRVDLGTRKQRAVLAALALSPGRPVRADTLTDLVWGEQPPATSATTLQVYVARLRKALE